MTTTLSQNSKEINARPEYVPQFLTQNQFNQLLTLYHVSLAPLAGRASKYNRMRWAVDEFMRMNPQAERLEVYLELNRKLSK